MCGIAGLLRVDGAPIDADRLARMTRALAHRGPDDEGTLVLPGIGLGARRLAVLDLSPAGHMPMSSADACLHVAHNGEIYNLPELRSELLAAGYVFRSRSDTEVILHAYARWGEACVERFIGMFAFALWDTRAKRLFVARDRLGVKPLYYRLNNGILAFASEAHVLLKPPLGVDAIDPDVLRLYLAFGTVPPSRSLIQGLYKVPPGHALLADKTGVAVRSYWTRPVHTNPALRESEALERVDAALRKAVRRRLLSDVPLGCFLSGGIDSSLVAALAAEASEFPLRTFCVGFADAPPETDERPLAAAVARRWKTEHTDLTVEPTGLSVLPKLQYHFGEPFADASALPTRDISAAAREHITVALTGDGGDEAFCGYLNVRAAYRAERMRRTVPKPLRRLLRGLLALPPLPSTFGLARRAMYFLDHYVEQPVPTQYEMVNHWHAELRRRLLCDPDGRFADESLARDHVEALLAEYDALRDPEAHLAIDYRLRLPGDYLPKVDIASSLVALEVRSPFLDHELVELAASIPIDVRMPGGRQKGLLRNLAARYLPAELLTAPKRGFAPPVGAWLRGPWAPTVRSLLLDGLAARAWFHAETIRQVMEQHNAGTVDHTQRIWTLICLEVWLRLFVDGSLSAEDSL